MYGCVDDVGLEDVLSYSPTLIDRRAKATAADKTLARLWLMVACSLLFLERSRDGGVLRERRRERKGNEREKERGRKGKRRDKSVWKVKEKRVKDEDASGDANANATRFEGRLRVLGIKLLCEFLVV